MDELQRKHDLSGIESGQRLTERFVEIGEREREDVPASGKVGYLRNHTIGQMYSLQRAEFNCTHQIDKTPRLLQVARPQNERVAIRELAHDSNLFSTVFHVTTLHELDFLSPLYRKRFSLRPSEVRDTDAWDHRMQSNHSARRNSQTVQSPVLFNKQQFYNYSNNIARKRTMLDCKRTESGHSRNTHGALKLWFTA